MLHMQCSSLPFDGCQSQQTGNGYLHRGPMVASTIVNYRALMPDWGPIVHRASIGLVSGPDRGLFNYREDLPDIGPISGPDGLLCIRLQHERPEAAPVNMRQRGCQG